MLADSKFFIIVVIEKTLKRVKILPLIVMLDETFYSEATPDAVELYQLLEYTING
jgi:hypothetical protein